MQQWLKEENLEVAEQRAMAKLQGDHQIVSLAEKKLPGKRPYPPPDKQL